jgi:hypothetical protein
VLSSLLSGRPWLGAGDQSVEGLAVAEGCVAARSARSVLPAPHGAGIDPGGVRYFLERDAGGESDGASDAGSDELPDVGECCELL